MMCQWCSSFAILVLLCSSTRAAGTDGCIGPDGFRLPMGVLSPSHYDLVLDINDNTYDTFTGVITLKAKVLQTTSCLVLNQKGLSINSASVTTSVRGVPITSTVMKDAVEMVIFNLESSLHAGQFITLEITYSGNVNKQNATGLFKSSAIVSIDTSSDAEAVTALTNFLSKKSTSRPTKLRRLREGEPFMLATQFEGPYARMAMPVLDEPVYKATWSATVNIPSAQHFNVTFNTPHTSITEDGSYTSHVFARTLVPMSNYLVSFAIGEFSFLSKSVDGCEYSIVTPVQGTPVDSSQYALDVTLKVVAYFTKLFGHNYGCTPGSQLYQVAVPAIVEDAMEDWGNMMYAPNFLLVTNKTTQQWKELVTQVIAHELFHSWFGDTVTTPWWNEVYLQEGFARWFQYVVVDTLFPEYNIFRGDGPFGFYLFAYNAMWSTTDSYGGTLPVVSTVAEIAGSVSTVQSAFSLITYGKGASLNQQLSVEITPDVFGELLTLYLRKFQFTNPSVDDLMEAIKAGSGFDAPTKFKPWLTTRGFPVVTLEFNPTTKVLNVSQAPISPYLGTPSGFIWPWIPIKVQGVDIELTSKYKIYSGVDGGSTFATNVDHTSYIAVNYGSNIELWDNAWNSIKSIDDTDWTIYIEQTHMLSIHSHNKVLIGASSLLRHFSSVVAPHIPSGTTTSWDALVRIWTTRYGYAARVLPSNTGAAISTVGLRAFPSHSFGAVFFKDHNSVTRALLQFRSGIFTQSTLYAAGADGSTNDILTLEALVHSSTVSETDVLNAIAASSCDVSARVFNSLDQRDAHKLPFLSRVLAERGCQWPLNDAPVLLSEVSPRAQQAFCTSQYRQMVTQNKSLAAVLGTISRRILESNQKFIQVNN